MRLISAASGVSMYRNATQFYQMARTYRLTSALPCIPDYLRQINTCFFSELSIKNGTFVAKGGVLEQKIIK